MVADLRLPGLSGVELQERVRQRGSALPFVIITAHGDVPAARAAFRANAVDFIEKPFEEHQLQSRHRHRLRARAKTSRFGPERSGTCSASLPCSPLASAKCWTMRRKACMPRKSAKRSGISARTVEVHKTRIMEKLQVRNIGELVRFALAAEKRGG